MTAEKHAASEWIVSAAREITYRWPFEEMDYTDPGVSLLVEIIGRHSAVAIAAERAKVEQLRKAAQFAFDTGVCNEALVILSTALAETEP